MRAASSSSLFVRGEQSKARRSRRGVLGWAADLAEGVEEESQRGRCRQGRVSVMKARRVLAVRLFLIDAVLRRTRPARSLVSL